MSNFINSHLIEPVVRHARRFSFTPTESSSTDATANATPVSGHMSSPPGDVHAGTHRLAASNSQGHNVTTLQDEANRIVEEVGVANHLGHSQAAAEDIATRTYGSLQQRAFPTLLPLDDVRGNFIFETPPVLSPTSEIPEQASSAPSLRHTEARTLDSLGTMSIDDGPRMTRNPSIAVSDRLWHHDANSTHSGRSMTGVERVAGASGDSGTNLTREEGLRTASPAMSGKLPDDDGMKSLRQQIHRIRDMAVSAEEKAKRMHDLMTAEYVAFKMANSEEPHNLLVGSHLNVDSRSPRTSVSGASLRSASPATAKSDNDDLILTADDLKPTYAPRSLDGTDTNQNSSYSDDEEEDRELGCKHYNRNVKIQCRHCRRWYTCRHCHDDLEDHPLDRKGIRNMLCMLCGHPQPAADSCQQCGVTAADYYCGICKLWENDPRRKIYHCSDCGICRRGEGLGKDYVHCKRCNVCISIAWVATHRCVERATECDCPICGEWMFTSSTAVVAMRCGHYIHRTCYDAYMQTSYKCPICNRSAVNMELQWRKLDRHIEGQPMPSQFAHTKVWITCNDCTARSCTAFHWLGNKCSVCDSYNTNEVKLVDSPAHHEAQAVANAERQRMIEVAEGTMNALSTVDAMETLNPSIAPAVVDQRMVVVEEPGPSSVHELHPTTNSPPAPASTDPASPDPHSEAAPTSPTRHSPQSAAPIPYNPPPHNTHPTSPPLAPEIEMPDADSSQPPAYPPSRDEDLEEDDVAFWGEPISPTGWSMPSMPSMPSIPDMPLGMPAMPNSWSMPNMPNMPNMPTLRAMPTMPTMTMPSMSMPSMPSMPSPLSSWGSPRFFGGGGGGGGVGGREGSVGGGGGGGISGVGGRENREEAEEADGEEEEEDSDDDMLWDNQDEDEDGEEEEEEERGGRGDEMELFGHR